MESSSTLSLSSLIVDVIGDRPEQDATPRIICSYGDCFAGGFCHPKSTGSRQCGRRLRSGNTPGSIVTRGSCYSRKYSIRTTIATRHRRGVRTTTIIGMCNSRTCMSSGRRHRMQKHSRIIVDSDPSFWLSLQTLLLVVWCIAILLVHGPIAKQVKPSNDWYTVVVPVVGAYQPLLHGTMARNHHRDAIICSRHHRTRLQLYYLDTDKEETSIPIMDNSTYHHETHRTTSSYKITTTTLPIDDSHLTYQRIQHTAPSSTEGLSKFHQSMLRHSGMNRQRFVTGRYPIVLYFRNNPTRKWLNLRTTIPQPGNHKKSIPDTLHVMAETEVYVNGTLASQSLASLDRFYWYDDHERRILQQEYGMVSMELLAEIHVDRPGYVNVMSSRGGGRRAATSHKIRQQQMQTGNRWTIQAMNLLKAYNEGHSISSKHDESAPAPKRPQDNDHNSRFIDMLEGITSMTSDEEDRLWVTGFALTGRQGSVTAIDCQQCFLQPLNERSKNTLLWPNEVQEVPSTLLSNANDATPDSSSLSSSQPRQKSEFTNQYQDAILVCDGFLVPTKDRGGIYVVKHPGHEMEWTVSLTKSGDRWFYHRAVWMDLTGDGRQSILTARCQVSTVLDTRKNGDGIVTSGVTKSGQLVWLECPKPTTIDPISGTPLESDGTIFDPFSTRHLPWKERVLTTGPDVMFSVADLDTTDDTIEVLASEFFNKQVTITSIQCGIEPKVTMKKIIDDQSGQAFGCILANLDTGATISERCVVNAGSTVNCLQSGNFFSHVLVTSHECNYDDYDSGEAKSTTNGTGKVSSVTSSKNPEGGSLFAYRVPEGKGSWRTKPWQRTTVASGFKVREKLNNMINPGAPGFVYTFYANLDDAREKVKRPLIAVAGDCAESAFIYRPSMENSEPSAFDENHTNYKLMAEIQCEATVGSIGIGYNDFSSVEQERGYAKLYIPCFETDKIMVFGLGSGEDDNVANSW